METGYMVCDAMTKMPVVVPIDATIQDCAKVMHKENVGSLLVKDKHALKGLITDEDIVHEIVAKGIDPKTTKVKEHMATSLITITPEKDIFEALTLMMTKNIKQLPVVDGEKMIGILTLKDVLKLEPELFDLIVDKIKIKEEEHKPLVNEGICQECGNYSPKLVNRNDAMICKECSR
jgi:signal-transduction protein with cAMP-binding, CBS, and nucleotidyltransferase domain